MLAETIEAGVTTRLEFDAMGRLMQRRAAAPGQPEQSETFAYSANGQLAEAQYEHARLHWFYDAAGNLVREHQHYQGPFHPETTATTSPMVLMAVATCLQPAKGFPFTRIIEHTSALRAREIKASELQRTTFINYENNVNHLFFDWIFYGKSEC